MSSCAAEGNFRCSCSSATSSSTRARAAAGNASRIVSIAGSAASALWRRRIEPAVVSAVALIACAVFAVVGANGFRHVLNRARTTDDHSVDVLTEKIEAYFTESRARRPLVHIEPPIWPISAGALLQVDKAGRRFAVEGRCTTMFGERFAADGREDGEVAVGGSPLTPVLTKIR